jgi:DNA modification methylase
VACGDVIEVLRCCPDNEFDAVLCDPPYGLSFMGKKWDYDVPSTELWREVFRVCKPGAPLIAFFGTRTYHRGVVRIEDAGFEIRDQINWLYGSGFPKSLDVSKAIDKANGRRFEDRYALGRHIRERREALGFTRAEVNSWFGYRDGCEHWERQDPSGARVPTLADWHVLAGRLDLSPDFLTLVERAEAERDVVGRSDRPPGWFTSGDGHDVTAPATPEAERWNGWGTALKPAHEPIVVARKPLSGTVAANVLAHGTGALNIDGCRVEVAPDDPVRDAVWTSRASAFREGGTGFLHGSTEDGDKRSAAPPEAGRWPANVTLTHAPDCGEECVEGCPVAELDRQAPDAGGGGFCGGGIGDGAIYGDPGSGTTRLTGRIDPNGGASRFFPTFRYEPKAGRAERNAGLSGFGEWDTADLTGRVPKSVGLTGDPGNKGQTGNPYASMTGKPRQNVHPTVKPIDLMRWLVRLVTPPGGTVLDPFTGSGSTGCAAVLEGFDFVGCEREAEYVAIARARIAAFEDFEGAETDRAVQAIEKDAELAEAGQHSLFEEAA